MAKNLYIGYDEGADELIITAKPQSKTVGYFIESGTAVLLGMRDLRPYGFSFLLLRGYFKKHKNAFAKVPLTGSIALSPTIRRQLLGAKNAAG